MSTISGSRSDRIVQLLDEPAEHRDADWLKDALQQAVLLELATLPPYLCGLWSIEDPFAGKRVSEAVRRVVFDEMSHLGLAGNLLTTIGGTPRLADAQLVPVYPGPLPGGVRPELTVYLSGLTKESLALYADIEKPEQPLTRAGAHTSIGAFYTAIQEAFRRHPELITGGHQLTRQMSHHGQGNSIVPLMSLTDVETALDVIKEQGEGTSTSPQNPHPGESGELAHFYVFQEIFHGRELVRTAEDPDRWEFTGPEIPMPRVLPMGVVPAGGWAGDLAPDPATKDDLDAVDRAYSAMLRFLEAAWQADTPIAARNLLNQSVGQMRALEVPSRTLMERPLPDGSGKTYGPQFLYRPAP
ncbi:ferritin-like protein [Streptomyces sp. NPDC005566]|uniref:ferritin-like domain-containing protein n=1 Tax=Streptomyces sp. NPDC005566 TaxID=3156886 RepID=UPI00339E2A11